MIAVIGTGLSGLVQAWALAQQGFDVTLIGPVPSSTADDRTTAILMPGIEFLKTLGLWSEVQKEATPMATMELIDDTRHLIFDAAEIGQACFGYNISNNALKNALVKKLKNAAVTWQQENATQILPMPNGWQITLQQDKKISTDFLIGADGANSLTRRAAGITTHDKHIDQSALVTILKAGQPHHDTSVEWYLPGGPLTLVPMAQKRLAVVWCDRNAAQLVNKAATTKNIEATLNAITAGRFGALRLDAPLQLWPVRPMMAQRLIAPRCALIGEAAHVLAPIGAQGFNLSLHDIMALTRLLVQGRDAGLPVALPLLHRYEKIRLPEITARYNGVNTLNMLLQSPFAPLHQLRRLSLLGIEKMPSLKRRLMHKGMTQHA